MVAVAYGENRQLLPHGMVHRLGGLPLAARSAALAVGIGLDHAGIDREVLDVDQPFGGGSSKPTALEFT